MISQLFMYKTPASSTCRESEDVANILERFLHGRMV